MSRWDVIVVGAGAAGLLAAAEAARERRVLLLEKNDRSGIKILMSGGTRCNLTHDAEAREIVEAFGRPGRFLHSALAELDPRRLVDLIEAEGVATKVESTGKVFPVSNKAGDVLQALLGIVRRSGVEWALKEPAVDVRRRADGRFEVATPARILEAERIIVTTGGKSYPGCGTQGDAYPWMEALGHRLIAPQPALTPVCVECDWAKALRGVTLPDVEVRVEAPGAARPLALRRGALLFAHFGLSGPAVLDVSRVVSLHASPQSLALVCDFRPADRADDLREQWKGLAASRGRRTVAQMLADDLPRRLVDALLEQASTPSARTLSEWTRNERERMLAQLKQCRFPITGTLGFGKAEVTAGGVALDEVDSRTMESRLAPGLFIAGELLDLDGPIGGYNFQAAFSTGALAGRCAASS